MLIRFKSNTKLVRNGLENLRKKIPEISRLRLYKVGVEVRHRLKEKGKKPTYPIQWDSEKQRKKFFATDGFGKGIPTKRTNEYVKAWTVRKVGEVGYEIVNEKPYAQYVGGGPAGKKQSKIHRGRWKVFRDVFDNVIKGLPKRVVDNLRTTARYIGFKTK